jgi:hypothetical protein
LLPVQQKAKKGRPNKSLTATSVFHGFCDDGGKIRLWVLFHILYVIHFTGHLKNLSGAPACGAMALRFAMRVSK